jgi:hypothetical protein
MSANCPEVPASASLSSIVGTAAAAEQPAWLFYISTKRFPDMQSGVLSLSNGSPGERDWSYCRTAVQKFSQSEKRRYRK